MKTKIRLKNKILRNLGQKIKTARTNFGLSQEALAFKIGVDRTYIGNIEQGKRSPSIYCLFAIASALNVSLKELADFDLEK